MWLEYQKHLAHTTGIPKTLTLLLVYQVLHVTGTPFGGIFGSHQHNLYSFVWEGSLGESQPHSDLVWIFSLCVTRFLYISHISHFITNIPVQFYSTNRWLARTKLYSSNFIAISVNNSDWRFESDRSVRICLYPLKCLVSFICTKFTFWRLAITWK